MKILFSHLVQGFDVVNIIFLKKMFAYMVQVFDVRSEYFCEGDVVCTPSTNNYF